MVGNTEDFINAIHAHTKHKTRCTVSPFRRLTSLHVVIHCLVSGRATAKAKAMVEEHPIAKSSAISNRSDDSCLVVPVMLRSQDAAFDNVVCRVPTQNEKKNKRNQRGAHHFHSLRMMQKSKQNWLNCMFSQFFAYSPSGSTYCGVKHSDSISVQFGVYFLCIKAIFFHRNMAWYKMMNNTAHGDQVL